MFIWTPKDKAPLMNVSSIGNVIWAKTLKYDIILSSRENANQQSFTAVPRLSVIRRVLPYCSSILADEQTT